MSTSDRYRLAERRRRSWRPFVDLVGEGGNPSEKDGQPVDTGNASIEGGNRSSNNCQPVVTHCVSHKAHDAVESATDDE